jgi:cobalt transporter subunit CbtB
MSSLSKTVQAPVPGVATARQRTLSRSVAAAGAALLGLVLVYGAGLAQAEILHNGAHDARHAAGFPCH